MHAVAHDRANAVPAHPAGSVGDDAMLIVQHHAETPVREDFVNDAFDGQQFFFSQLSGPIMS